VRIRVPRSLLRRALLSPAALLSLLVLLASTAFFVTGAANRRPAPPRIEISAPDASPTDVGEVRLMTYGADGLESPKFARVELPREPGARVEAVLEALRGETLGDAWPEALPAPQVFVETIERERIAILDFRPQGPVPLTVSGETRLLRSIEATVRANGADQIRFLLNGEAAGVFLEHLAVPAAL
jgi:hypothetical protein